MMNNRINNKNIYISGLLFIYLIAMGIVFLSKPVHAEDYITSGDWTYYVNSDDTITLTSYNGKDEKVTVPAEIDGYSVGTLYYTFSSNTTVKSITVSEGILSLDGTFGFCSNLESVILPESLEYIYSSSFYSCSSLKDLKLGKNVKYIGGGSEVFYSLNLETFAVDEDNPNFSSDGVLLFDKEKTKVIASPIHDLQEYSMPDSVKEIGEYGLAYTKLNSKTLSDSIVAIERYGLYMAGLDETTLVLPSTLKTIGDYAFQSSGFKTIEFGAGVESIGINIINLCEYLEQIIINKDNPYFYTDGTTIFSKDKTVLYETLDYGSDSYTIPYGVKTIKSYAFYNSYYKNIIISDGVETIEYYAFAFMSNLTAISFPDSVETISDYAFSNCSDSLVLNVKEGSYVASYAKTNGLTYNYITEQEDDGDVFTFTELSDGTYQLSSYTGTDTEVFVPNTYKGVAVTGIGSNAFSKDNYIETIHLPASVKTISDGSLSCGTALKSIIVDENSNYFVSIDGVLYDDDMTTLYVCPPKAVKKSFEIPYGVDTINDGAFMNCSSLETVTIPRTVKNIWDGAFENCNGLETLRIPREVTLFGSGLFKGCSNVMLEVYEDSLAESYADNNDISYTYVNEYLDKDKVFTYEIKEDNTIIITEYIGKDGIVIIPDTIDNIKVTEIGDRAFAGDDDVTDITIGENITAIGNEAFADCDYLRSVSYKGDDVSFGESVYDGSDNVEVIADRESDAWKYARNNGVSVSECMHKWNAGVVTREATVSREGERTYTCTICGETKTETIPRLTCDHDWDDGIVTREATVSSEGERTYTCTICGETRTEIIPRLSCNHIWNDGIVTREATVLSEGEKTYTCVICGETRTETIPSLTHTAHTWNAGVVTKAATYKTEGIKTYTCTVCGETRTETISKLICSHRWNEGVVTKYATVLNEGVITYKCPVCGEKKTETIPKQDVKIGSQANSNGVICTITSTDKCTVECTGLENNNMTVVDLTTPIRINNDTYIINSISDNAFRNNQSLSRINTGNIETIGENAFMGCQAGLKIDLSKNNKLKSVEKGAFGNVSSNNIIYPNSNKLKIQYQNLVEGSRKSLTEISGKGIYRVLNEKKKTAVFVSGTDSDAKSITIPATVKLSGNKYKVTVVGKKALYKYKNLKKIVFGKNVEKVEKDAISWCVRLNEFTFKSDKLKVFQKSSLHKLNHKKPTSYVYGNTKKMGKILKGKIK